MALNRRVCIGLFLTLACGVPVHAEDTGYWVFAGPRDDAAKTANAKTANAKTPVAEFRYRSAPDSTGQPLESPYTILFKTDEVRCDRAPCDLYILSGTGLKKFPFPGRIVPGKWISLSVATEEPGSPLGVLQTDRGPAGAERAGRTKSGTCPALGLAIQAPVCEEVIDIDTFSLEWKAAPGREGHIEIRLTVPDSRDNSASDSPVFTANIGDGKYEGKDLRNQIAKFQSTEDQTRLTIEMRQSDTVYATRVVVIPTRQEDNVFQRKLAEIDAQQSEQLRPLERIRAAVDSKRWTFAAREAIKLLPGDQSQKVPLFEEFALIGLCQSGYREKLATVRADMAGEDTSRYCAASPEGSDDTAVAPPLAASGKKKRAGWALLIGNSDYPGDQLDSVRSDVENMHKELQALNFEVIDATNLDKQEDFKTAIVSFTTKQTADDVVLIYYSGHGMQEKDKTYLLGTKFATAGSAAYLTNAFGLDEVIVEMQKNPALARIVIFDACRNNVFTRDKNPELGEIVFRKKIKNTFILLANKPGQTVVARSGGEFLSPFTEGLLYGMQHAKGGIIDIFNLAKTKTMALSPDQVPEMERSDEFDANILSGTTGGTVRNRPAELMSEACPYYHSQSWALYISLMKNALVLSDDPVEKSRVQLEIDFATLVQQAQDAGIHEDNKRAEQAWHRAAALFPGRNWARMQAALSALLDDNVVSALTQLANMPAGPDPNIAQRAGELRKELEKSFPSDSQSAMQVADNGASGGDAGECVPGAQR